MATVMRQPVLHNTRQPAAGFVAHVRRCPRSRSWGVLQMLSCSRIVCMAGFRSGRVRLRVQRRRQVELTIQHKHGEARRLKN